MNGKVAVVTGGSRGIGRAIALRLAREGAEVAFSYRRAEEEANQVVDEIEGLGRRAISVKANVSESAEAEKFVSHALGAFGQIDVLINNAGILGRSQLLETTDGEWDRVIDTNLKSVFLCSRAVVRHMMSRKSGAIVNIASVSGLTGGVAGAHYAASKGGVIAFTKSLARQLAPRVRVNAVAPGPIETEMISDLSPAVKSGMVRETPLGRFGVPEDIAGAVAYLASDKSSFITGQVIVVDGGRVMY